MDSTDNRVVRLCFVLGSTTRLSTLHMLMHGKRPVDIARELKLSQPAISKAVHTLESNGLIRRDGRRRNTTYHIPESTVIILEILESVVEEYMDD